MLPINTHFTFSSCSQYLKADKKRIKIGNGKDWLGDLFCRNRRRVGGQVRHTGNPFYIGIGQKLLYHTSVNVFS